MARQLVIEYGGFSIGSGTTYEVHGPTGLSLSFEGIMVSFDVVVTSTSLETAIQNFETAMRKRDQELTIRVGGADWGTYTPGQNALNTSCSFDKPGDIDSDTGNSRTYSVTFVAEHAADDQEGLRSINANLMYATMRQPRVEISGEFTALDGTLARDKYLAEITARIQAILDLIDDTAVWERDSETHGWDRNNHILQYDQTFLKMIYPKSTAGLDHPSIKGHRVVYTRLSAYPGDSDPDVNKPETVFAEYSCVVDTEAVNPTLINLSDLYEQTILPFLAGEIQTAWNPRSISVVQNSRQFEGTASRITGNVTFIMYMQGSDLIEKTETIALADQRQIDYTPVWSGSELAAYADQGHMIRTRSTTVTETRFGEHAEQHLLRDGGVRPSGWNKISGQSSATPQWVGEGDFKTQVTILASVLVERFTQAPGEGGGSGTIPTNPGFVDESVPSQEETERARAGGSLLGSAGNRRIPGGRLP